MKVRRILITLTVALALMSVNNTVLACAACFGKSDSPMAKGMNAGIFCLLGVVAAVLSGAATFFVFLARRASHVAREQEKLKE